LSCFIGEGEEVAVKAYASAKWNMNVERKIFQCGFVVVYEMAVFVIEYMDNINM